MEERLVELETRVAYLEYHIEDLNRILAEQGAVLTRLDRQMRFMQTGQVDGTPSTEEVTVARAVAVTSSGTTPD